MTVRTASWLRRALPMSAVLMLGLAHAEDNDAALQDYADLLSKMQTGQVSLQGDDPAAKVKLPPGWTLVHRGSNKGFWVLIEGRNPKDSKCLLMFAQNDNKFMFASPKQGESPVAIYTGPGMDSPAAPQKVDVTMRLNGQSGHAPFAWMPGGYLITPIKLQETVNSIVDRGDFEMMLNGKTVLVAATEGGFKGRDAMLACMAKHKLR